MSEEPERSSRGRKDGQCALTWPSATFASAMGQAASAIGLGRTSWWRWTYLLMAKVGGSSMKGRSSAFAREGLMRTCNLICGILMFVVQSAL